MNISESEYYSEIESICAAIVTDYSEGADFSDCVHEIVDSHEWITYTRYHLAIYEVSGNTDAWKDCYSDLSAFTDLESIHQAVAYFAMVQDVHDAFQGYHETEIDRVFCEDNKIVDVDAEAGDLVVEDEYGDLYRFADKAGADLARRLVELGGN
jgi:hypothetical protein